MLLVMLLADTSIMAMIVAILGPRSTATAVLLDRFYVPLASAVVYWLLGFLY